ncbi:MAG TPA: hypothetical protein VG965_06575 [Patescibacteria group bacterium]|nr:hypothetical protein [Patescibacteria group bacterium]
MSEIEEKIIMPLNPERREFAKATAIADIYSHAFLAMSREDRIYLELPDFIDRRSLRNSLARNYLDREPHPEDMANLQTIGQIKKWLDLNTPTIED